MGNVVGMWETDRHSRLQRAKPSQRPRSGRAVRGERSGETRIDARREDTDQHRDVVAMLLDEERIDTVGQPHAIHTSLL